MSDTETTAVPSEKTEKVEKKSLVARLEDCLLYTSPSPRD